MQAGVASGGTSSSPSCLPLTCYLRCQHEKHHAASRKKTWHCWLRRPLHRDEIQYRSHPPLLSLCHFLLHSSLHSFSQCITLHQTFNQNLSSFLIYFFLYACYRRRCWKTWAAVIVSSYFAFNPNRLESSLSLSLPSCCFARGNIQNRSSGAILAVLWILLIIVCVIM